MIRAFTLLAAVLGTLPTLQPQTISKHTRHEQTSAQSDSKPAQSLQSQSQETRTIQPAASPVDGEPQRIVRIPETVSVSVNRDWSDKLVIVLDVLLLIVGVLGSAAAFKTLSAIRRQADLMKQQSDLTVNERRARLKIKAGTLRFDTFIPENQAQKLNPDILNLTTHLSVSNVGYSRAFIVKSQACFHVGQNDEPIVDTGSLYSTDLELQNGFLDPDTATQPVTPTIYHFPRSRVTLADLSKQFFGQSVFGPASIILFGFIEYETLGIRWRREYRYKWSSNLGFAFLLVGSEPKNDIERLTSGSWAEDTDYFNDEYVVGQPEPIPTFWEKVRDSFRRVVEKTEPID